MTTMASSTVAMLFRCEEPRRAKPGGLRDHGDVVVVNLPCPRSPRRARWIRRRPPCRTKVHNDEPPVTGVDNRQWDARNIRSVRKMRAQPGEVSPRITADQARP